MPSPKISSRRGQPEEKNRRPRPLSVRSSSFHGQFTDAAAPQLRRPKTVPDMASFRNAVGTTVSSTELRPKLTKLLLNVTIQGSVGAVQVVMSPESKVGDLVAAAVRQYGKEGRRPILPSVEPSFFDLHYSQFSLESLDREKKLMELGSRNFFLCPNAIAVGGGGCGGATASSASCSKEAEKVSRTGFAWLKFMDFLL
ncbi:hypothetical protein ACFX13_030527 [Malus domestica]|uniref:DUF7054 domain-containing protein n=1 Tax=Malus domestica TaxID=3750 RepID=A0A498KGW5_MALDO|nr:uncharacterized protein At4g22758-like [Malus domestica]XP_050139546.1 uncharacterized protein At4g22758-like [Malus sylvestris]RXI04723.1 hypothetical protein DVH24_038997 [Malus domestica]